MSKVKRKLTFTEVKFNDGGRLLPAKRLRHHPNVKKESNSDVRSRNVGPFRALQTDLSLDLFITKTRLLQPFINSNLLAQDSR